MTRPHGAFKWTIIMVVAYTIIGLLVTFSTADAQTNAVGSASLSGSQSQSGAEAGSLSGAEASITFNSPDRVTTTATSEQGVTYRYEGRQRIATVPDALAPGLAGGNPCVISASGAGSGLGFGFSIGVGIEDPDCEIRQQVALLGNMGYRDAALLHFCMHSEEVAATIAALGYDCAGVEKSLSAEFNNIDAITPDAPVFPASGSGVIVNSVSKTAVASVVPIPAPKPAVARELRDDGFHWEKNK